MKRLSIFIIIYLTSIMLAAWGGYQLRDYKNESDAKSFFDNDSNNTDTPKSLFPQKKTEK
ncbi:MAG: hypothetical protein JO149_07255 [Gammaproteobacteria bacterium]|nr:hypothetical protein [Gammaproteobacteria bacterium]